MLDLQVYAEYMLPTLEINMPSSVLSLGFAA